MMKHRLPFTTAFCVLSVILTAFVTSTVRAQGVIPYENMTRGGVQQFDPRASGVRRTAPGVREYGNTQQTAGPSYFGIMGAVASGHAGTYSSSDRRIELGRLVQSANGFSNDATGMGQIIRNGRVAFHVFPTDKEFPLLLPGDLVVFQKEINQQQPGQDRGEGVRVASGTLADDVERVEVAMLGILPKRPIVIWPERDLATIPNLIKLLHQPAELSRTVAVIRTDSQKGVLPPGHHPDQLVDGDVLIFDSRFLDPVGLSQAEEFPPAIPISGGGATTLWNDAGDHTAGTPAPRSAPAIHVPPVLTVPADAETSAPAAEPLRTFEDTPLTVPSLPTADADSGIPFAPIVGEADDEVAVTASVEPVSHHDQTFSAESTPGTPETAPVPAMAVPELPVTRHLAQPAPVVTVSEKSVDLFPELAEPPVLSDPGTSTNAYYEATSEDGPGVPATERQFLQTDASLQKEIPGGALLTQTSALVPRPRDATLSAVDDGRLSQLRSLNTASIALAVLVLAAMCFVVSVIWSRIDRTARALQQERPQRDAADPGRHRQTLDRLIENELPIIEERAAMLPQTDYHGQEVGRKRLMIDEAHSLAGPHFAVGAPTDQRRKSKDRTRRRTPLVDPQAVEARLDRAVEHVRTFQRNDQISDDEHLGAEVETIEHETPTMPPQEPVESREKTRSKEGLLDRVLVAMERERRR